MAGYPRVALVCLISIGPMLGVAQAQLNLGGIVNEIAKQAGEQQRRHQEQNARQKAEQSAREDRRRRDAEIQAQQKAERDRSAALEREQKAEQQRQQRVVEEARQRKEAAAKMSPAVQQLIRDATEFVKTNPPHALELVEQIANLNTMQNDGDAVKIQSAMQTLIADLRREPGYQAYEQQRGDQEREEANRYLKDLIAVAQEQRDFIRHFVTRNPTSTATKVLLPLIRQVDAALANPSLNGLKALTTKSDIAIRETGLADEFVKTKTLLAQGPSRSLDPQTEQSALRRTAKNAFLIDGALEDFVLLWNSSGNAPNVVKNLRGEIDFERAQALACIYTAGFVKAERTLLQQKLFAVKVKSPKIEGAECNRSALLAYDVIAIERGAFLRLKADMSLPVLAAVETGQFNHLSTVTEDERKQASEQEETERSRILSDIKSKGRDGFGMIVIDKNSAALCLVGSGEARVHKQWLLEKADTLTEFGLRSVLQKPTVEEAYKSEQRKECGAIYAGVADLNVLVGALSGQAVNYQTSALWTSPADIEAYAAKLKAEEAQEARLAQQRKIKAEAEAKEAALKKQHDANTRERRQAELRSQYGRAAHAAAVAVEKDIKAALDSNTEWRVSPGFKQYPRVVGLYHDMLNSRWELNTVNTQVEDFGTAEWKGRSMDTILAQIDIQIQNRILGEYKNLCFVLTRSVDAEFSVFRETEAISCDDTAEIRAWKIRQGFRSRYIAE